MQNDKVHQDIVYCFRTETYILYENLILQQPLLKGLLFTAQPEDGPGGTKPRSEESSPAKWRTDFN